MAIFTSYDMKGQKLSFANWISNLSPSDTPFVSMTGKETVDQVRFSWQTDRLAKPTTNAQKEGEAAGDSTLSATTEHENFTQILRKVVRVTDSTKKVGLYGRQSELSYQMEKAGLEIKRDLEHMFLTNGAASIGSTTAPRITAGFETLCAGKDVADVDTGAVTTFDCATAGTLAEADLWKMTYNLYLVGSKADTIMLHPIQAGIVEKLTYKDDETRTRLFKNLDTKVNVFVSKIRSPLGQEFTVVYNRYMPKTKVFFFNASDWTQMVFRAPERTELAKTGSATKYMIEMEVGLRHRHPHASGVLNIGTAVPYTASLRSGEELGVAVAQTPEEAPVVAKRTRAAK